MGRKGFVEKMSFESGLVEEYWMVTVVMNEMMN